MAQGEPVDGFRQQRQEGGEVVRVELLRRGELPVDGAELLPELGETAGDEALDRFAGLGQHAPVGREARPLEGEDEAIRRLLPPFSEALGLLRAVERAVDLDGGELAARIFELALL